MRHFFRKQPIYVISNIFLYYREGDPNARKAPDIMVVKNVGNHDRRSFKVWEEKAMPSVVFEITSRDTEGEDTISKSSLYAALGIREYFLFDPLGEYLEQQFMGCGKCTFTCRNSGVAQTGFLTDAGQET